MRKKMIRKYIKYYLFFVLFLCILNIVQIIIPQNYLRENLNIRTSSIDMEDHRSSIFNWFVEPKDFFKDWHWLETKVSQESINYQTHPDNEEKANMFFRANYKGKEVHINQFVIERNPGWDFADLFRQEERKFSEPFSAYMEVFFPDIDIPVEQYFVACERKYAVVESEEWVICRIALVQDVYFERIQIVVSGNSGNKEIESIVKEFVTLMVEKHKGENLYGWN